MSSPAADLAQLLHDLETSNSIGPIAIAANAIVDQLVGTRQLERLATLVGTSPRGDDLLEALRRSAEQGNDVFDAIAVVFPTARARFVDGYGCSNLLVAYIACDAEKLARVTRLLAECDRPFLVKVLDNYVNPYRDFNVSASFVEVAPLLASDDVNVIGDATYLCHLAAEAKLDLAVLVEPLEKLVSSPDDRTRDRAAYALSFYDLHRQRFDQFDRRRASSDDLVRGACEQALRNSIFDEDDPEAEIPVEIVVRLVPSVTDPNEGTRRFALARLVTALEERAITIEPKAVEPLFDALDAGSAFREAAELLAAVCQESPSVTAFSLERLSRFTATDAEHSANRLREWLCRAIPDPVCRHCAALMPRTFWRHEFEAPRALVHFEVIDELHRACPICATRYRFDYTQEIDDGFFSQSWELTRIASLQVRARDEARLQHPRKAVREASAWELTFAFFAIRDWSRVAALAGHVDPDVRMVVANVLCESLHSRVEIGIPLTICETHLRDTRPEVRRKAASAIAHQALRHTNFDPILTLLARGDAETLWGTLDEISNAKSTDVDISSLIPALTRLATHEEPSIRRRVEVLLK